MDRNKGWVTDTDEHSPGSGLSAVYTSKSRSFPDLYVMQWNITMRSLITKKWNRPPLWHQHRDRFQIKEGRPTGTDNVRRAVLWLEPNFWSNLVRYKDKPVFLDDSESLWVRHNSNIVDKNDPLSTWGEWITEIFCHSKILAVKINSVTDLGIWISYILHIKWLVHLKN